MKVDIWSDIRCPFCYIGKRRFETALERFAHKDKVTVNWRSFELDPSLKTDATANIYDYLAKSKGKSRDWAVQMHRHVLQAAGDVGLDFHFDKAVIANSFNAHRLVQFAKAKDLGNAAEEALFTAQFIEEKNIDDDQTLIEIGTALGFSKAETAAMLASGAYTDEVREDENMAYELGINGVPFFVFNNKYGVSGAQPAETFVNALQQTWAEYEKDHPQLIMNTATGAVCDTDGTCIVSD